MFPTIFSLALRDESTMTKLASSLLIMTIVGCGCSGNHGACCGYYGEYGDCLSHTVGMLWGIGGYAAMPRYSSTDVKRV